MNGAAHPGADHDLDENDTITAEDGDDDPAPAVPVDRDARVCTEPGCMTVLSRYNATNWCGVHHRRDWRATREVRRRSA